MNWFKLDGIVMMAKILSELESIHCIREFCFSVAAKSLRVGQQPAIYFRAASGTLAAGVRVNQPTKAFSAVTLLFRFSGRRCCNLSPLPLPIVIAPLFRCLQHQWWRLTAPRKQNKKKNESNLWKQTNKKHAKRTRKIEIEIKEPTKQLNTNSNQNN